jgi:hypothetical protein
MNFGDFFTMVPMWVLVHPRPKTTQTSKFFLKKNKLLRNGDPKLFFKCVEI